jgi:hypothetical protein
MTRFERMTKIIQEWVKNGGTPLPPSVENWCGLYLHAKDEVEREQLRSELSKKALIRDEVIFLMAMYGGGVDDRVLSAIEGKNPTEPFNFHDIDAVVHSQDWNQFIHDYWKAFRAKNRHQK